MVRRVSWTDARSAASALTCCFARPRVLASVNQGAVALGQISGLGDADAGKGAKSLVPRARR